MHIYLLSHMKSLLTLFPFWFPIKFHSNSALDRVHLKSWKKYRSSHCIYILSLLGVTVYCLLIQLGYWQYYLISKRVPTLHKVPLQVIGQEYVIGCLTYTFIHLYPHQAVQLINTFLAFQQKGNPFFV